VATAFEAGEACDDDTDDGCGACRVIGCGDGIVEDGQEQCDDGNDDTDDDCVACRPAACGDGFIRPGEECDDGNTFDDATCTADCRIPRLATVTARSGADSCSGVAVVDGVVSPLDGVLPLNVRVGQGITFEPDPGCSPSNLLGCIEETGPNCTVDDTVVEASFVGLPPHQTVYGGGADVRLKDVTFVNDQIVAVGNRDGTLLSLNRNLDVPQGFAAATVAATTTIRALFDGVGSGETGLDLVHHSGTTTILVGTATSGVDLGGSCQLQGRGAAVFFVEGNSCTRAVGINVPAGTLAFKGVAGTATDLWLLADFVVEGSGTISDLTAPAGAVLIRLVDASVVDVVDIPGLEPIALVTVGRRLAVAGRVRAGGTVPWIFATAPQPGDGIVGLVEDTLFPGAVPFRGLDVEITALDAHDQRVLVGGHWRTTLLVDGVSPIDSTNLTDGFVVELTADDDGGLTLATLRPLQGDSDDRIHGVFIDGRSVGFLSSSTNPSRFSETEIPPGFNVTTATLDGAVRRSVPFDAGTGGRPFGLRRGSGSAFAVVAERLGVGPRLEGLVLVFGAP
jgi:cysteine-rich repeat protein